MSNLFDSSAALSSELIFQSFSESPSPAQENSALVVAEKGSPQVCLSRNKTLILPTQGLNGASHNLILDGIRTKLYLKSELQLTIIGLTIGLLLRDAIKEESAIEERVNFAAQAQEWKIIPTNYYFYLVRDGEAGDHQESILRLVKVPGLSSFLAKVEKIIDSIGEKKGEALSNTVRLKLLAALRIPPLPHLAIYTLDPEGYGAISINSQDELLAALKAGQVDCDTGLRAFQVAGTALESYLKI